MSLHETIRYNLRGSDCPLSDHNFAESVAVDICQVLNGYAGCVLEIECYTPPYEPALSLDSARCGGLVVLHLRSSTMPYVCVGIEFGRLDKEGSPLRETIDTDEWQADPESPLAAGVYAANFDEAWRIVCLFGLKLSVASVQLSYGD